MEIKATAKYIRIAPRKVRLVANLVRGKNVAVALSQLKFAGKNAALPVSKVIASAVANAVHNFELSADNLFIKEIRIDGGPALKRWLPRAHGRATPLHKHMSHINVTLGEIKDSGEKKGRTSKLEAPLKLGAAPVQADGVDVPAKGENAPDTDEKGKKIVDPRREGRSENARKEGGKKGFTSKLFNRKAG